MNFIEAVSIYDIVIFLRPSWHYINRIVIVIMNRIIKAVSIYDIILFLRPICHYSNRIMKREIAKDHYLYYYLFL